MLRKKICMLGAFAVGKTTLVARFVRHHSTGPLDVNKYHTTVGVKVDTKLVRIDDEDVSLAIWDMAGEDEFQKVKISNLTGASGYLMVADGTRRATIETARLVHERATEKFGHLPFIFLINKSDLTDQWEVDERTMEELRKEGWTVLETSAKTGEHVEEAFLALARKMLEKQTLEK